MCLVLFWRYSSGKGVFPTKLMQIRDDILARSDRHRLPGAFSQLGEALGEARTRCWASWGTSAWRSSASGRTG
ncbi:MAG: hypothetical protein V8S34_04755 [Lawsonibacter sp.]